MTDRYKQLESLIKSLSDIQADHRVQDLLASARTIPQSAESRLRQVEQVLEAYRAFGPDRGDAADLELLLTMGRTYDQFAHLEKAIECYRDALTLAERLEDRSCCATVLRRMGKVLLRRRQWQASLDMLNRAQAIYVELGDLNGQARVALNRGIVLHEQGDYAQAQAVYQDAIDLAEVANDVETVADAQSNLAVLATIQGDLDGAIVRYLACLTRFEVLHDRSGMARIYHNLGMTYAAQQNWKGAMSSYEQALELAQKMGMLDVVANVYLSRAELLLELGDTSMAASCCALALDIYRELSDFLGEADTFRLMGRVFAQRRQWGVAESLFEDSIRLNREYDNPLNVAETQRDLGRMLADWGQYKKARTTLELALEGFKVLGAQKEVAAVAVLLCNLEGDADKS
jgi:tetratricopeptide (TPR) repeat protein